MVSKHTHHGAVTLTPLYLSTVLLSNVSNISAADVFDIEFVYGTESSREIRIVKQRKLHQLDKIRPLQVVRSRITPCELLSLPL